MPFMMHKLKSVPKLRVFKTENRFISPEVVYYRPNYEVRYDEFYQFPVLFSQTTLSTFSHLRVLCLR